MIYPATGWSEMAQIPNKTAAEIADIAKKTWFTLHPLPQGIRLIVVPNLWLNFPRCIKTTMASKGNQLQLGIHSPMQ